MNETTKGLLIGAAIVGGCLWWNRRRPRGSLSSLDGSMAVSTLAGSWRGVSDQASSWANRQAVTSPPGGGLGDLKVRGYGGPVGFDFGALLNGPNGAR